MNFVKFVELCGGIGYCVEKYEEFEIVFEKVVFVNVFVVIDVVVVDELLFLGKILFG